MNSFANFFVFVFQNLISLDESLFADTGLLLNMLILSF